MPKLDLYYTRGRGRGERFYLTRLISIVSKPIEVVVVVVVIVVIVFVNKKVRS